MKIAMVFDALGVGGIEQVGASYARLLVKAGHEVDVINLQPDKNEMVSRFPDECSYKTDRLATALQPDLFAALLKRPWGKFVYPLAYLSSRALLLAKKGLTRLTHRGRYDVAIAFSGHLRDLTYVAYNVVKSKKRIAWAHGAIEDYLLLSYAFAFLYERIRNLCVLSTAGQSRALECFPRLRDVANIHHIYNPIAQHPVSVNETKCRQMQSEWGDLLVMVGRFDNDKDQKTVIRALSLLRDEYQIEPHLIFVGDGPTRAVCEELVKNLGLARTVHFAGTQSDVDTYFLASKLAIHSSPAEGLPTVVLEAMRDGIPVLATNSLPGVPEILGDGEFGTICKVGDPYDMASKLHDLLLDSDLRASLAEKGRQRVSDFSEETIGAQLEDILVALR